MLKIKLKDSRKLGKKEKESNSLQKEALNSEMPQLLASKEQSLRNVQYQHAIYRRLNSLPDSTPTLDIAVQEA